MKSASQNLINLLRSANALYRADLLTFTLSDGTVLRYTNADIPLTIGGNIYQRGIRFVRDKVTVKAGVEVDTLQLTIYPDDADTLEGTPFLQAVKNGALDSGTAQLDLVLTDDWNKDYGSIVQFYGRIGDITQATRTQVQLEVKSYLELLDTQMPRNLFMPGCQNTLFDAGCALAKANWAIAGSVGGGSTTSQINAALGQADGYFSQGHVQFTSGANNGATRMVKAYQGGSFSLVYPLLEAPVAGDTFTIYPGCDGQQNTCSGRFNNLSHFRGQPYIPLPETVR